MVSDQPSSPDSGNYDRRTTSSQTLEVDGSNMTLMSSPASTSKNNSSMNTNNWCRRDFGVDRFLQSKGNFFK